ncbi:MAG: L-aspartate oxidase [Clostridia bacterium]|nr:L-aspartate oxidase [Clostridia bacterium]
MSRISQKYDVVIVGAGVAGLNCANFLPKNRKALVICKEAPQTSDSYLAQGGICRLRSDDDYDSFYEDTMRAGHNENNPETVRCMIENSRHVIDGLIKIGVDFQRNDDGSLACTREGGHSVPRICFHEDCTGKEIHTKVYEEATRHKNIQIEPYVTFLDLICKDNVCYGIVAEDAYKRIIKIYADYVVLATGGIGGIYRNSTNFRILTGDAIAVCMEKGVAVDNVNYVQIHPTSLFSEKEGRRFLISESIRGEGAVLLDKNFNRFCDELQPRDVVSEKIWEQMEKDGTYHVWLDLRPIPRDILEHHFPGIVKRCREEGYDVFTECIPVVPAQHYYMGGIRSDTEGKTTMERLYAVGETCCNGVHGKNRLASNSLLESLLFAERAAGDIEENYTAQDPVLAAEAEKLLDMQKYGDVPALLSHYKQVVREAIEEADRKSGVARQEDMS